MFDLQSKIANWSVTVTAGIIFFGVVYLSPILTNAGTSKQLIAAFAAALTSFGVYKSFSKLLLWLFGKFLKVRKVLLGDAFLEGTWVGHYKYDGLDRFTVETINQVHGDTRISGREFDEHGKTRADWSSEASFLDMRRERLIYVYSCDVYHTKHQQNGIGIFKLIKSEPNRPPDILDGYAVDMIDGDKDPNCEHKISDIIVSTEHALIEAKRIFGV